MLGWQFQQVLLTRQKVIMYIYTYIDIILHDYVPLFFLGDVASDSASSSVRALSHIPLDGCLEEILCAQTPFFSLQAKTKGCASTEVFRLNRWPIIWSNTLESEAKPLMLFHVCVLSFCRSLNWKTTSSMPFFLLFPLYGAGSFKKSIFIEEQRGTGDSVDV